MGGGNQSKRPLSVLLKCSHMVGWSLIAEVLNDRFDCTINKVTYKLLVRLGTEVMNCVCNIM